MADGTIMKIGEMGNSHLQKIDYRLHLGMGRNVGRARVFHAFKQKYGASVSSRNIGPARTEVYCRAILHNIDLYLTRLLGQITKNNQIYKHIPSYTF